MEYTWWFIFIHICARPAPGETKTSLSIQGCARGLIVRDRYQDETLDSETEAETEAFVKPSETRPRRRSLIPSPRPKPKPPRPRSWDRARGHTWHLIEFALLKVYSRILFLLFNLTPNM